MGVSSRLPSKSNISETNGMNNKAKKSNKIPLTKASIRQVSTPSFESEASNEFESNE